MLFKISYATKIPFSGVLLVSILSCGGGSVKPVLGGFCLFLIVENQQHAV